MWCVVRRVGRCLLLLHRLAVRRKALLTLVICWSRLRADGLGLSVKARIEVACLRDRALAVIGRLRRRMRLSLLVVNLWLRLLRDIWEACGSVIKRRLLAE